MKQYEVHYVVVMLDSSSVVKFAGLLNVLFVPNSNLTQQHEASGFKKDKSQTFSIVCFCLLFVFWWLFYLLFILLCNPLFIYKANPLFSSCFI
jgi:hypothetical protein